MIELDVNLQPYDIELDSPILFRRIEVHVPDRDEPMVFLTNHLEFAASTIAAIYKERWKIELLFKALKQNLRIKTFVGTSSNALHIQIWTALIAMLILRYLQLTMSSMIPTTTERTGASFELNTCRAPLPSSSTSTRSSAPAPTESTAIR